MTRSGKTTRLPLSTGRHRIGGGHDCDIVILGVPPTVAFHLELAENGSATLQAIGDGIVVDRREIKQGERVSLKDSAALRIAGVECSIEGLRSPSTQSGYSRRRIAAALLLALAAGLLVAGIGSEDAPASIVATVPAHHESKVQASVSTIVAELDEALRLAGLDVKVEAVGETAIHLGDGSPALDTAGEARLASIVAAVRRRSPVPIVDLTSLSSGLKDFVAAAGYEPMKFIVGHDGKRYREGETLTNGWHVREIARDHIVVARGEKTDIVPFTPDGIELGLNLAQMRSSKGL
nr:hypothetical protein [uncultured Shinella sp.]